MMISKGNFYSILSLGVLFSGCVEKGEVYCVLPDTSISSNSPVISGDNITLQTPEVEGATYHWTGPNGFESNLRNPVISKSTVDMSGEYKLVTSIGICKTEELSTEVTVIKNITTCTVANNNMTFTNAPFSNQSFFPHYTESGTAAGDLYGISTGNNNLLLDITFKSKDKPKTGNYSIVDIGTALTDNTVHVKMNWQYIIYYKALSGDISVSFSNGKFVVSFCSVPFINTKSTGTKGEFTASTKFTEE
jgi:hypothetical protein